MPQSVISNTVLSFEGLTIQVNQTMSTEAQKKVVQEVAAGATDVQIGFDVPIAQLKAFAISSDKALTVKTNSSSVPQETFNLLANAGQGEVDFGNGLNIISGNLTDLFVTNAGGTAAVLKVIALFDPTP